MKYDCIIVGAGFAGVTFAERAANIYGKTSLIVERRKHIGGNSYDRYDDHGVLIHQYGPHYFRTNSPKIKDYLSQFTEWHPVEYKILSYSDGRYWNFPINLNTFEQLMGRNSTTEEMEEWLEDKKEKIENPQNSEDVIVSQVGRELYDKFFKGYTLKQWKRHPKELDASVCGRIPIRTNRDDRYLREEFQAIPKAGYTRVFENMLDSCGNKVKLMLNTDYKELIGSVQFDHMVYTGPIDDYYDFRFGELPYRSLRFEAESFMPDQLLAREKVSGKKGFWQPAMQVNYPNDEDYTRIVEVKHATGQLCENTTIIREYPEDYVRGKEAYYPIPAADSAIIYYKYKELSDKEENISFIGRLATYKYYNMDQIVGMALNEVKKVYA
jgi:UDP-galactopyranose mutase